MSWRPVSGCRMASQSSEISLVYLYKQSELTSEAQDCVSNPVRLNTFTMLINELFNSNSEPVIEGAFSNSDSAVTSAIIRRILLQRTDLLAKYGPDQVGQAVDDVADSVGDWDEIGSSDVSGWVRQVEQMLGNMQQDVAESTEELYGLRAGDTVRAMVNGKRVQGDVIDIFPETMEVELLLRGANAGQTVTVDVRDTEALNEQSGSTMNEDWRSEIQDIDDWANAVREKLKATPQAQRLSMAQKLSQIEKKNFGSETTDRQRYNNQTGNVDANRTMQGLSNVVYEVYMDLKNQANSGPVAGGFGSTGVDQSNMYAQQQAQYDTSMANHYQQHIDDYALMSDPDFTEWYEKAKESLLANSTDENARRWSADQVKRFGTKVIGQRNDIRAGYKDAYYTPQVKAILDNDVALAAEIERRQRRNFEEFMDNIEAWRKNWNNVSDKNKEKLANMTGQTIEDLEEIISSGNIDQESLSNPDDIKENSPDPSKLYQRPQLQFSAPQPPPKPARIWQPSVDGQNQKAQTDKNGRTQAQWADMVMKKFPTARIAQGKGPFSKTTAILPDGRQIVWTPTMPETINAVSRPNMSGGSDSSGDPYDFIKPGAMVKFGMWNKPQEHKTGRVVKMANGIVTVTIDGGKTVDLYLGNKSLSIAPVSADQQGVAEDNDPYKPEPYDEFASDTYGDDNPEDEPGVTEAIPYALSAANANAEYERTKTFVPRGYKGRVDTEVSGQEEYRLVMASLKKLAQEEGQHIEAGLSGTKMSIFSKTMGEQALSDFVDMALDNFDQGVAEGDIGQLEKDIAAAPVEPIANLEAQEKIGDRHDADDFDSMVSRLKKLAGSGPMKTVYDPNTRRYKNVPVAQQPTDKK